MVTNKQETAEAIKVMQAWVDDSWPYHIEFSQPEAPDAWCPVKQNEITWDFASFNYRIKPKPREFWINDADNWKTGDLVHVLKGSDPMISGPRSNWIHVFEILD